MPQVQPNTQSVWFRLMPFNRDKGYIVQTYQLGIEGTMYKQGKWYRDDWTPQQLDYCRSLTQVDTDPQSPPLFQMFFSKEEWEACVREEKRKKAGLDKKDETVLQEGEEAESATPKVTFGKSRESDDSQVSMRTPKTSSSSPVVEEPKERPLPPGSKPVGKYKASQVAKDTVSSEKYNVGRKNARP